MEIQQRKNEIAQRRGWSDASFWIATAGKLNDFHLEREYPSLGELARELEARENDIDFMKAMRESYKHVVQGSVRSSSTKHRLRSRDEGRVMATSSEDVQGGLRAPTSRRAPRSLSKDSRPPPPRTPSGW
jgi:hypothetical protein